MQDRHRQVNASPRPMGQIWSGPTLTRQGRTWTAISEDEGAMMRAGDRASDCRLIEKWGSQSQADRLSTSLMVSWLSDGSNAKLFGHGPAPLVNGKKKTYQYYNDARRSPFSSISSGLLRIASRGSAGKFPCPIGIIASLGLLLRANEYRSRIYFRNGAITSSAIRQQIASMIRFSRKNFCQVGCLLTQAFSLRFPEYTGDVQHTLATQRVQLNSDTALVSMRYA